ncbi:MAG: hypothetical protein GWN58_05595, partial [Anaerolineae bacterium]|nr:hypothetical protein [Anaerolineae bacterium]
QLLTTGMFHQINTNSLLGVEAVLAYQSYGTARLGMKALGEPAPGMGSLPRYQPFQESGYGTGVRL